MIFRRWASGLAADALGTGSNRRNPLDGFRRVVTAPILRVRLLAVGSGRVGRLVVTVSGGFAAVSDRLNAEMLVRAQIPVSSPERLPAEHGPWAGVPLAPAQRTRLFTRL
jgi:hypothetical protein